MYESSQGYRVRKSVHARNLRWTITDCDVSPSEAFMVYCSITPTVHMVRGCETPVLADRRPPRLSHTKTHVAYKCTATTYGAVST